MIIQDNEDGSYSISFTPTIQGNHRMNIKFGNDQIGGSPIEFKVVENLVYRRDYNQIVENQQPTLQFGSSGNADGQFSTPWGVATNSQGEIIVCDYNHRIQIFNHQGQFLKKFGTQGNQNGQFSSPIGVSIDPRNEQIIVADLGNHRVQIFDSQGNFIRVFGSQGNGDGQFSSLCR